MEAETTCPYCGEAISLWVDPGGGGAQTYVEDCSVCCKPIELSVSMSEDGEPAVHAARADE